MVSILSLESRSLEIILVDDGSTDTSAAICDSLAIRDSRVRVIHQKNMGLSGARNSGIFASRGEYLLFVDSDDWIDAALLGRAYGLAKRTRSDVVFLDAMKVFPDGGMQPLGDGYSKKYINAREKNVVLQHIATLPKFPGSACTKMIRRELVMQKQLFFMDGLVCEDIDWTVKLLSSASRFAYCPGNYYYYRQGRAGSITFGAGEKSLRDLLYIIGMWSHQDLSIRPFQEQINAYMAYELTIAMSLFGGLPKHDQCRYSNRLLCHRWLLAYGKTRKIAIVDLVIRLIGMKATSELLHIYLKLR